MIGSKCTCCKGIVSHTHGQAAIPHNQLDADYSRPFGLEECAGTQAELIELPVNMVAPEESNLSPKLEVVR